MNQSKTINNTIRIQQSKDNTAVIINRTIPMQLDTLMMFFQREDYTSVKGMLVHIKKQIKELEKEIDIMSL